MATRNNRAPKRWKQQVFPTMAPTPFVHAQPAKPAKKKPTSTPKVPKPRTKKTLFGKEESPKISFQVYNPEKRNPERFLEIKTLTEGQAEEHLEKLIVRARKAGIKKITFFDENPSRGLIAQMRARGFSVQQDRTGDYTSESKVYVFSLKL